MTDIAEKLPTRVDFLEQVGTVFEAVAPDDGSVALTLTRLEEHVVNEVQENFSLLFRAPVGTAPRQGIYPLTHARLGRMEIFLVPVKSDAEGLYLEAVFNNLIATK